MAQPSYIPPSSPNMPSYLLDLKLHHAFLGQFWGQHLKAKQQVRWRDCV